MRLFVSYARQNRAQVESLVRRIQQLDHEPWIDSKLEGGQAWWDEILAQIRRCDAFVFALSQTSIESEACDAERAYAAALGKPVVPIAVAPVRTELLPPDVAGIQIIDYANPSEEAAIQLARSIAGLRSAPPLPDPLPPAPPVPTSYLSELGRRVTAPTLSRDEQLALVDDLRQSLHRARNRENRPDFEAALDLVRRLEERSDLYATTAEQIQSLRTHAAGWDDGPRPESTHVYVDPSVTAIARLAENGDKQAMQIMEELAEDEQIYMTVTADLGNRKEGILAATDRRLLFSWHLVRSFFKAIDYRSLLRAEAKSWYLVWGKIALLDREGQAIEFSGVSPKDKTGQVVAFVNDRIDRLRKLEKNL